MSHPTARARPKLHDAQIKRSLAIVFLSSSRPCAFAFNETESHRQPGCLPAKRCGGVVSSCSARPACCGTHPPPPAWACSHYSGRTPAPSTCAAPQLFPSVPTGLSCGLPHLAVLARIRESPRRRAYGPRLGVPQGQQFDGPSARQPGGPPPSTLRVAPRPSAATEH